MAGIFSPIPAPARQVTPTVPGMNDDNVQKASEAENRKRNGRASTFMMNPQSQRTPGPDGQRYLGGL